MNFMYNWLIVIIGCDVFDVIDSPIFCQGCLDLFFQYKHILRTVAFHLLSEEILCVEVHNIVH